MTDAEKQDNKTNKPDYPKFAKAKEWFLGWFPVRCIIWVCGASQFFSSLLGFASPTINENHYLRFGWHLTVFAPIIIITLIGWLMQVPGDDLILFLIGASSTVSLEICVGCVLHKAEHSIDCKHEKLIYESILANVANQAETEGTLTERITDLESEEHQQLKDIAKLLLITVGCVLMFSALALLEVLRMKEHSDSKFSNAEARQDFRDFISKNKIKFRTTVIGQSILVPSKDAPTPAPGYDIDSSVMECDDDETILQILTHLETGRKTRHDEMFTSRVVIATYILAFLIIFVAIRKLWIVVGEAADRHDEVDDFYLNPLIPEQPEKPTETHKPPLL